MIPSPLTTLTTLALLALSLPASAAYPRFTKYEECVAYCDQDTTCQSAFWDTISGDCQYHACIWGQTPPARFRAYVKVGAKEYCAGTSPTGGLSLTTGLATATGTGTGTATGVVSSATGTSGAEGRFILGVAGRGAVVAVAGWVVMGLMG